MKFAYLFNYRIEDTELFALECNALFGVCLKEKVLITDVDVSVEHSPFLHEKMTILSVADTQERLCQQVTSLYLESDVYKVEFLGTGSQIPYSEQLALCKRLGFAIEGDFSLKYPKVLFGVFPYQDKWYFGTVERMNKQWMKHFHKPYSYTYSLPTRLARICVSLATRNDKNRTLVDPCCGVGTVLLEAMTLGYTIKGFELNPPIAENANLNCAYYGYPEVVTCGDMTKMKHHADCAILDIPYGVMEVVPENLQKSLLLGCRAMSDELVLISAHPMEKLLKETGWIVVAHAPYVKQQFVRTVSICRGQNVENDV